VAGARARARGVTRGSSTCARQADETHAAPVDMNAGGNAPQTRHGRRVLAPAGAGAVGVRSHTVNSTTADTNVGLPWRTQAPLAAASPVDQPRHPQACRSLHEGRVEHGLGVQHRQLPRCLPATHVQPVAGLARRPVRQDGVVQLVVAGQVPARTPVLTPHQAALGGDKCSACVASERATQTWQAAQARAAPPPPCGGHFTAPV
jgi:hypothetical protein